MEHTYAKYWNATPTKNLNQQPKLAAYQQPTANQPATNHQPTTNKQQRNKHRLRKPTGNNQEEIKKHKKLQLINSNA